MKKVTTTLITTLCFVVIGAAQTPAEIYSKRIAKADSAYFAADYRTAYNAFREAFTDSESVQLQHLYNAASVAALAGERDAAIGWLYERLEHDPAWYSEQLPTDPNLASLHDHARWQPLADTMTARRNRIEASYDKPLRERLQRIFNSDQAIRYEYIQALNANAPQPQRDSLLARMQQIDRENIAEIEELLTKHGWIGRDRVGNACVAVWAVVQHADIEVQTRLLPMLRDAATAGDLAPSLVAMLEDRINVHSGRPQRYGSQILGEPGAHYVAPLEDASRVDEWRKEVGMEPMAEYVKQWNITWNE